MIDPQEREHFQAGLVDDSDKATAVEMLATQQAIADVQNKVKRSQEADQDGNYKILDCLTCGDEIGEGRLNASIKNTLCIHCATRLERR